MLTGKTVLLGVSGGIACYKAAQLASDLVKQHANVHVVMTRNAAEFITPLTFEALTGNRPVLDTFDRNFPHEVKHISLAEQADLVLIAMGFTGPEETLVQAYGLTQDARGSVLADGFMTVRRGVFAAGDMRIGQSLVVRAIDEGQRAAKACHAYLTAL